MTYAETKAAELIEREIERMPLSQFPRPDQSYAIGMIELAYASALISCEQYRGYTARINQAADERHQELWRAAPVKSLVDDQVEEIRHAVLTKPGQSLPDALGLPPETRFVDSGICSPMTIKRGRKALEVRS